MSINNIKFGFLNYTYGTNGIEPRDGVVVDYINRASIKADVEAARQAGAELVCSDMRYAEAVERGYGGFQALGSSVESVVVGCQQEVESGRAELVAVCIHWGDEYKLLPNKQQKHTADFLEAIGVDMVIGSHPHVIQPMELRPNRYKPEKNRCN